MATDIEVYLTQMNSLKEQNEALLYDWSQAKKNGDESNSRLGMEVLLQDITQQLKESPSSITPEVARSFGELCSSYHILEQYHEQLLDENRKFGDIILQPQNAAEVRLVETATQFLPPHELDGAVRENLPASTVLAKVETSKIMKQNLEFSQLYQQQVQQITELKEAKATKIQQEVKKGLGGEFGVLDSLSKGMSHADKVEAQRINNAENQEKSLVR